MATALHPVCTQHGITPMQLRLLLSLYYDGPQTASTLAENNCMAHGNSSALCKRLAQQGYILRQRPPQDERRVLISLSPAGRQ
ncbi:MarR family transcriptional regulator, partial [Ruminococcaceae bacterium OttesenSCG-928-O06]|nr:MarR family transcriptional regulator [Ruminococcaceae bacterium OttesenSCG-928-O06]